MESQWVSDVMKEGGRSLDASSLHSNIPQAMRKLVVLSVACRIGQGLSTFPDSSIILAGLCLRLGTSQSKLLTKQRAGNEPKPT